MTWERIDRHNIKCSACGRILTTSLRAEVWKECPYCHEKAETEVAQEEPNGNFDADE